MQLEFGYGLFNSIRRDESLPLHTTLYAPTPTLKLLYKVFWQNTTIVAYAVPIQFVHTSSLHLRIPQLGDVH